MLRTPKRGLGRAYIDALPYIRGRYVLMGDCDCTYDFRELAPFVEKFRGGAEFVMGSRFRGYIEPGSMPPLHRYLGTPVTTWILNVIFGSRFSDIHCGMRGITKDALGRMDLRSQSWEYASEMVLKSVHMKLRTEEVPIRFLKDREGRLSHHKRSGWFSPWQAAWINLRAMFVYGADFFLYKPGLILLALGLLLTLPLSFGTVTLGPITFSLHWMLLGLSLAILGLQCVYMGILSQVFFDYSGDDDREVVPALSLHAHRRAVGAAVRRRASRCGGALTAVYVSNGFRLLEASADQPPRHRRPPARHQRLHDLHVHAAAARDPGRRAPQGLTSHFLRPGSIATSSNRSPSPREAGRGSGRGVRRPLRLLCRRRRGRLRLLCALCQLGALSLPSAPPAPALAAGAGASEPGTIMILNC